MASLNLSTNGPSITKSYQSVVNSPPASGATASSGTYGQWALFTVAAPLVSAFQHDGGGKESVLKVQSTGEGELVDLIEDFSDGRIQFAFLKVKDPNTTLPKNVLISWCGEGVPERTKGYFNSHRSAVSKILHGYHVEITARSDRDLTPESIVQKVADASGSKYSGGGSVPSSGGPPPPVSSKPVFTPTAISGATSSFNPLGSRSRAPASSGNVDNDGWGADAPELTRTQLEKVAPAYKPTKVNLAELTSQKEPSRYTAPEPSNGSEDVVKGAYQPVGKVDINEIRRKAAASGEGKDDRPTIVKGAYEPVGKVDIAAIRARAQGGPGSSGSPQNLSPAITGQSNEEERPKSLAERSGAFQQSERLTSMPKPKVANKFGGASSFTGTKAPAPGGFSAKTNAAAAPVGIASRTFADEGGKTPAQIWAEKKARQGGGFISPAATGEPPIRSQPSGEGGWKSGYTGKSWGPVQTTHTGKSAGSNLSEQRTGQEHVEEPSSPAGGVGSIRERFASNPPPLDSSSKPNSGVRGVPMPGLPSRPSGVPAEQHVDIPPPPAQPRSPSPPTPDLRPSSPIRVAMPVSRTKEPEEMEPPEERFAPAPVPAESMSHAADASRGSDDGTARSAGQAAAATTFGAGAASANPGAATSGKRALISYDYEKAEDNELELREGEYVTDIEMVDEDWWMGKNSAGETGLFPSNYVELVEDEEPAPAPAARAPAPAAPQAAPAPAAAKGGKTATAQYDYEAAEDNELSFPDGATIHNIEFPDDDWWFGEFGGKTGLFPANYVELDQ